VASWANPIRFAPAPPDIPQRNRDVPHRPVSTGTWRDSIPRGQSVNSALGRAHRIQSQIHPMAGHNKWSKVKHVKGPADARRGRAFSRIAKEIAVAARTGGGDPDQNPRLRSAIQAARDENMPNDTIDRAVRKGTGELEGGQIDEIVYEGYGPGGVAVIVEVATDNRNRSTSDVRTIFTRNNGSLGSSGSVSYMFRRKGQVSVPKSSVDEDRLLELILDAGAEELSGDEVHFVITTPPDLLYAVVDSLKAAGVNPEAAKLTFIPDNTVAIADETLASQILRLCDALEESDDVQNVHANFDIADDLMAKLTP
jgi:YebC/PmpR family DNA-binding regulatory protein